MKTGKLVALSEQYMIDCGKAYYPGRLFGCDGGNLDAIPDFIHNFGLELRKNVPYFAGERTCPFHEEMDIKKTGYIRMPIEKVAKVYMNSWADVLPFGPLMINFAVGDNFHNYGGGIFNGTGCGKTENHAMVVVGHGRAEGKEFWLYRNSFGKLWGEGAT